MFHPQNSFIQPLQVEGNHYTEKHIACPGCKENAIVCHNNNCKYAHVKASNVKESSKLFCPFGYTCFGCARRHDFDEELKKVKCPWECMGRCRNKYNNQCPYGHGHW
eukprot:207182_1